MIEHDYLACTRSKRVLQAELKQVQEKLDLLEAGILAAWEADGITSMKVETGEPGGGRWLLYQSTRVFAKQEFVELAEVPMELHMLSSQRAASQLQEMMAKGDKEGLERLAAIGILPIEKVQIHVKKG